MPEVAQRLPISPWVNPVIRALREGKVCMGACTIAFPGPAAAQIFAEAGFSWLYMDMEHSQATYSDIAHMSAAAKLAGIVPIAGPTSIEDHLVARTLDAGAMGVVVPHVSSAAQAANIVEWAKYAPVGKRGLLHFGDATGYRQVDVPDWVDSQNREVIAAVKVESGEGIDVIDEIASVPGLDAILIGPGDLSTTLGVPGKTSHPSVTKSIEKMLQAAARHGIAGGPHVSSAEEAEAWADRGATFMAYSFDGGMLAGAARAAIASTQDLIGDRLL